MKYIKQDITTVERGVIIHGVNCLGVMGSGVALALRNAFPIIFEQFSGMPTGKDMLGTTHIIGVKQPDLYVANCYTQVNFGSENIRYADLDSVKKCVTDCYEFAAIHDLPVCSAKIASLRGGLDWDTEVEPIFLELNKEYEDLDVAIYYI